MKGEQERYTKVMATCMALQRRPMDLSKVYITIGLPFSSKPLLYKDFHRVAIAEETPLDVALKLRRNVAINVRDYGWEPGPNFSEGELYFAIYLQSGDAIPIYASANHPQTAV